MEYKVFKAKSVNDAITDALIEFSITSDMLDYEVVDEGYAGLLGFFSKEAVIKARPKETEIVEEEIEFSIKEEFSSAKMDLRSDASSRKRPERDKKKPVRKDIEPKIKKKDESFELKPDGPAESEDKLDISISRIKPAQKAADAEKAAEKPVEKGAVRSGEAAAEKPAGTAADRSGEKLSEKAAQKSAAKEGKAAAPRTENPEINDILNLLFEKLGITAQIETSIDPAEKVYNVNIIGDDTGDIIGKKGQTLDAIQYLISIIVNKKKGDYYRVKVDTNNYRERRQKTLENQAKNVAAKVKKTRRKVVMEPMNPYERRIIHSYLQSDKSVTTKSEGEEPNRKIVVFYKKG